MKKFLIGVFTLLFFLPCIVFAETNEAIIGETEYTTLEAAYTAATAGDTIKLLGDVTLESTLNINKNIIIDLNGHNIAAADSVIFVQGASLEVKGSGTIKETTPYFYAIGLKGSDDSTVASDYTKVVVGKDVILEGWAPVFIRQFNADVVSSTSTDAYGVIVDVYGTLNSVKDKSNETGHAMYINGKVTNKTNYPVINVHDGTVLNSLGGGIYAAGYAEWNVGKATITAVENGIAIKAGFLNLTGTSVTASGDSTIPVSGYSNGVNASGAALQIESNDAYGSDMEITIDGGIYKSINSACIYEYLDSGNTDTEVNSFEIKSGTFISAAGKPNLLFSSEFNSMFTKFIKGGTFTDSPETYVADGYKVSSGTSGFTVSKIVVAAGTYTISGTVTGGADSIIQLRKGSSIIRTLLADSDGKYSITNVAKGEYNITFTNETNSAFKYVEITNANVTVDATLSGTILPQIAIVQNELAPATVINNSEVITNTIAIISITQEEKDSNNPGQTLIQNLSKNDEKIFIEINIRNEDFDFVSSLNGVLEFIIDFDPSGKENINLYRAHAGIATKFDKLTSRPAVADFEDGSFYLDSTNKKLYVYASDFSLYGIGYTTVTNPKTLDNIDSYIFISILSILSIFSIGYVLKKTN